MKVLHLLASNRFSGAENVACQIISMFREEKNIEIIYCSPDGQIQEALQERNIAFIPLVKLTAKEVKRVIKQVQPDIIHAHDMRASFMASRACGKIKLISHIHNNNFDSRGLSLKSILYYFAAKKASHIFWVSQSSFEGYKFHKSFKEKSTVLYNIIDANALKEKMQSDKNTYAYDVVFLGRLTPQKNPHRLINVLEQVIRMRPETKAAIVGTGELEEEIKQLVKDKGLTENVIFLGFQNNPYKILHDAKVMLMTSRWEGTPMCALEAMALGIPIVSTPTDGLKDIIKDGENGYLSNSDDELTDRIMKLIDNNEVRTIMSNHCLKSFEKYNDKKGYKDTLLNVYGLNYYE